MHTITKVQKRCDKEVWQKTVRDVRPCLTRSHMKSDAHTHTHTIPKVRAMGTKESVRERDTHKARIAVNQNTGEPVDQRERDTHTRAVAQSGELAVTARRDASVSEDHQRVLLTVRRRDHLRVWKMCENRACVCGWLLTWSSDWFWVSAPPRF